MAGLSAVEAIEEITMRKQTGHHGFPVIAIAVWLRTIRGSCLAVVLVSSRTPDDDLYQELAADPDRLDAAGIKLLSAIGDALSPSTVQAAVHAGH